MGRAARRKRERQQTAEGAADPGIPHSKSAATNRSEGPGSRRSGVLLVSVFAVAALALAARAWWTHESEPEEVKVHGYRVLEKFPHDPTAFTQGLLWYEGSFYESTGKYGRSQLRRVAPKTGKVQHMVAIPSSYFGEGLARVGDQLIQLTWQAGVARYYDLETFALKKEVHYEGEGWGLAYDGKELVMSDGTSELRFLEPETLRELRRVQVTADGKPVLDLNELEIIDGEIWANLWQSDLVARIDPKTGHVRSWVDFHGLLPDLELRDSDNVLNGIAYDADTKSLYVTGKRWPNLFKVEIL